MLIKAALNGSRSRDEHPAIPFSAQELAEAARDAVAAGAGALHIHPRHSNGRESLAAPGVAAALLAIRSACPNVAVGVSTGAWMEPDLAARLRLVAAWETLPDFASVNFDEPGAEDVARLLLTRGVGVEAGLSGPEAARRFVLFDRARDALRVLIEPTEEEPLDAEATAHTIDVILTESRLDLPRLLHGTEGTAWPMLKRAVRRGYDTRIGFEDTLALPDGRLASSNAELVRAAMRLVKTTATEFDVAQE